MSAIKAGLWVRVLVDWGARSNSEGVLSRRDPTQHKTQSFHVGCVAGCDLFDAGLVKSIL